MEENMKEVHFVIQGKGGVGKSFIASVLAQYFKDKKTASVNCYDTDPVNPTLSRYNALNVKLVPILTEHKTIDTSLFDSFIEALVEAENTVSVIDNGAATFVPLINYVHEINLFDEIFKSTDVKAFLHVPIVGGQAFEECIAGFATVCQLGENFKIVPWLNEFQGEIETPDKKFSDFKVVQHSHFKILDKVTLPNRNPSTFGKDVRQMTEDRMTFNEVMVSKKYTLIPRQRLKQVRDDVYRQLDAVFLLSKEAEKVTK
ncbi:nucleotide-binding protein [Oligella urethralis]|uniref:Conjugal transfer protein TraL n=1 Tax=Oligella urethralis TaxID=90245 RepID=A0A2X1UMS2_9BURK|nr:conjugal transfer protein TraL [Oligella urethralis]SPY08456.1 conjugal transfer protein TraL [Oligella urethralis]